MRPAIVTFLVSVAAALVSFALFPRQAIAHSTNESYVYLDIYDDIIEGRIEYPVDDLSLVLDVGIPADADAAADSVATNLGLIHGYSADHLSLGIPPDPWPIRFDGYEILSEGSLTVVVVPFVVDRRFDPMPRRFEVTYDGIISEIPDRSALLLVATDWRSGTFNNVEDHLAVFDPSAPTLAVDLGDTSLVRSLWGVVGLGIDHIRIGSDHILFIIALLLPAVLYFYPRFGWRPAESFGASLWRVVKIATSFTVAHTITLTLGGLGFITMSPDVVEPLIALSIGLAAWHNLRPVIFNREWAIAFGFGLIHGFGFASLLTDLGLDRSNRVMSLLGFNLGIEVGQVAIVLLLFPALFIMRRTRAYMPLFKSASGVLMVISAVWLVERVVGGESLVTRLVEEVLQWPRPVLEVGILTTFAIGLFLFERRRGQLLAVSPVGSFLPEEKARVGSDQEV